MASSLNRSLASLGVALLTATILFSAALQADAVAAEWMPDGRLLVLARNGVVTTSDPTTGTTNQVLTISNVSNEGERGALDLALHPDFATNKQFFVYHATDTEPSELRIIKFVLDETSGVPPLLETRVVV